MLITLTPDRLLHPQTGTLLLIDRKRREVRWVRMTAAYDAEADRAIAALDSLIRRNDLTPPVEPFAVALHDAAALPLGFELDPRD